MGTSANSAYDFGKCKICASTADVKYRISCGRIFVCSSCQFHFLDFLDQSPTPEKVEENVLAKKQILYVEKQLHSSPVRFDRQVAEIQKYGDLSGKRVLDIGCGGGLFLNLIRSYGAEVVGLEWNPDRLQYCKERYNLNVVREPIESEVWHDDIGTFDFVTLWDVIEHVNFPLEVIQAASAQLKPGGVLLIDTPSRDGFYHRFGVLSYKLTQSRLPTFLNTMYSDVPFGHKQILASKDLDGMFMKAGLEKPEIRLLHELTFPYKFYLVRMLRSEILAALCEPLVHLFFKVFRIKNKMLVSGVRNQVR